MSSEVKSTSKFKSSSEWFSEEKTGVLQLIVLAISLSVGTAGSISFILNPTISGGALLIIFGAAALIFAVFLVLFFCGLFSKEIADKQTAKSLQKWAEHELNVWVPLSNLLPMVGENREQPTGKVRAVKNERPVVVEFTKVGTLVLLDSTGSKREPSFAAV